MSAVNLEIRTAVEVEIKHEVYMRSGVWGPGSHATLNVEVYSLQGIH